MVVSSVRDGVRLECKARDRQGGIAILYGNLAPEGAVVKQSAVDSDVLKFKGSARVYNCEEEAMKGDDVDTGAGKIPKNLALQFIQALRLIVADGSASRQNRGIFKIHHDLQIAPTHVVEILEEFGEHCEPTCVMSRSELEYERGEAP